MPVLEQRVGVHLSYAAIAVSVAIAGGFWFAGLKNPRAYASTMAINHHNGYGANVACYACHVPTGGGGSGFFTSMTCLTMECHGELMPGVERDRAIRQYSMYKDHLPDHRERAEHHLDLHTAAAAMSCWDCHQEHAPYTAPLPEGWVTYEQKLLEQQQGAAAPADGDQVAWLSVTR
jgi:hypothetical protein